VTQTPSRPLEPVPDDELRAFTRAFRKKARFLVDEGEEEALGRALGILIKDGTIANDAA
jgi:hypothetical protein